MSSIRGRAVMVGGVQVDEGATPRIDQGTRLTRPAFRYTSGGQIQPSPGNLGLGHPLLDLSTVGGWRILAVAVAVAYVIGFHITLGRSRIGLGPGR